MSKRIAFFMAAMFGVASAMASTTWYVDARHGSNGYSGLTAFAPKRTIQSAINAASSGDWIIVAGGTYAENLTLSKKLTLFSHEHAVSIIEGRHAGHCLLITENASGSVVDGFVFTHGAPTNAGNKYGGGVDCLANATIRHCVFKDNGNSSTTFAGGLHTSNRAQVTVENCLFTGNYAWACGGASLTEGGSTATFDRCTVYGNKSDDFIGNQGGIGVANTGKVIVKNSILWGNTGMQIAAYGSGYGAQSTIRVSYSCVQGGVAANGAGHFYDDGGNISSNPMFINIARRNFWFRDNSPCWRKGHPDFYERDGYRLHMGFWPSRVRPLPPPVWTAEITLDAQGGDCSTDVLKRFVNSKIGYIPEPQMDGYDFLGWFDKAEGGRRIFPEEIVRGNKTLYAQWKQRIPPLFSIVGTTSGIRSFVELDYSLEDGARDGKLYLNGELLTSTEEDSSKWIWQPQQLGENTLVYDTGKSSVTTTVNVASLTFATTPQPNPPMPVDDSIVITPEVRTIPNGGAGKAIIVQGGAWTAAASDPWIVLGATSGTADEPVAYSVSVNTNIGERVGYVYVSGRVHTITQKGRDAELSTENVEVECEGGSESVALSFDGRYAWDARPNVDWVTVSPTHGIAAGSIDLTIAPYNEVGTRTGTVTFGDRTVTVFQYGRRIKLSDYALERDYLTHVIPITVNALAVTEWSATLNASWISIVDSDNGQGRKGAGLLTVAISENPSYRARTGTVTIGTETFTITQEGRPASECEFSIDPISTMASVNGANGHIAVTATPDFPWTVTSNDGWLALLQSTAVGDGNGNIFYTASPNSTLLQRTGTITVTPTDPAIPAATHTVVQPGAVATLSPLGYEFEASGGAVSVQVTVPGSVEWSAVEAPAWITIQNGSTRVGSGTVTLQASPNGTINARSGTVKIAERLFTVAQKGRGFTVDYDDGVVFSTDGDMDSFSVYPDGDMEWEAYASDTWIQFMYGSNAGSGAGEVIYVVSPYVGDGTIRTGSITIGDKEILVSQRAYDLSISPRAAEVSGNSGAGEISVSAGIDDVWNAIRTEPWITIEQGYDSGTGSGTVRFTYTDNDTGITRSGRIVIAGEVYTITQASRVLVDINAQIYGHGHVEGAGTHSLGTKVTLTAVPDDGYQFQYWTGDAGETMQNPITVTADVAKNVTATFAPLTPEFISAESSVDGVRLTWTNLAWAAEYRIYRAPSSEIPSAPLVTLAADGNCTYLDTTGDLEQPFWYWVEAVGTDAETESQTPATGKKLKPIVISPITYENLRGASHTNPSTYQEGTVCSFTLPTTVTGYTFAGWDPAGISADVTGPMNIRATWTANTYSLVYHANGGSGTMDATACTYDSEGLVSTNGFVRAGYEFLGWATVEGGAVVYEAGARVRNLSAAQNGVVELWAVWESEDVELPVITPADGSIFKTDTCTVTITCATSDAQIYYTTNGRTPTESDRYRYTGPFTINGTTTVTAFAAKNGKASDYVEATITYVEPVPLTWKGVLDEAKLGDVTTGGDAEWQMVEDASAKVGDSFAVCGIIADDDEQEHSTYLKVKVNGKGTLTYWWRVDCESDPRGRFTYDHGKVEADGVLQDRKDGQTGWLSGSITFDKDGQHEITWTYVADGYPAESGSFAGRMWVDGLSWSGDAGGGSTIEPSIEGDEGATVTGDAENGYTITPSANNTAVEVAIPSGISPSKVTVEVGVNVATVVHNGANVKVMNHGHDITAYLDIPDDGRAASPLAAAIKESIAREPLDPAQGAVVDLGNPSAPSLTTPATRLGLTYTLREGASLETMVNGASKQGDGQPWTPPITVKGGTSGFYTIKVEK